MEQCRGRGGVPLPIVRAVLKDRGEDETVNKWFKDGNKVDERGSDTNFPCG